MGAPRRLAAEGVELTVAVDGVAPPRGSPRRSSGAAHGATLLVELDVGLHRTGQTTAAGALALAQALSRLPAVEVAGISCYPGHCRGDAATIARASQAVDAFLRETRDAFAAAGLRCDRISGGSTPTRYLTHETCINELRSGTYALLDRVDGDARRRARCAVAVTVISDAVPGQIVIDAGSKTLTSDSHDDGGHGAIVGLPGRRPAHDQRGARLRRRLRRCDERPAVGDRLQVIPNHACGCVNLHDGLLAVRDGVVEHVIRVVGARPRALDCYGAEVGPSTSRGVDAVRGVVGVADLADARLGDHRQQQRRLRPRDLVVLDDPREQLAVGLARAPLERLARDERRQARRPSRCAARSWSAGRVARLGSRRHERADLGRPDDLAVAHERLAVAEVEPAAGVRDRQDERGAGAELAAVHVPAVAALQLRVQLALGRRTARQPISGRVGSVVRSSKRTTPPWAG